MKTLLLLLALFVGFQNQSTAQVGCNYSYTLAGNTATFQLPLYPLIYSVDSVNWVFGDGSSLFQTMGGITFSTPHTYPGPGTYYACLQIWLTQIGVPTPIFCTSCDSITISGTGTPCNASFTSNLSGSIATFTSTSSGPGTITAHSWNFGDGSPVSTAVNPVHTYTSPGMYTVCHTITGTSSAGTFTCTTCNVITVSGSTPCNASFTKMVSGSSASFTSTSTGPGPITAHSWNFGDGSPVSTATNPTHVYAAPGLYNVCHTITGGSATGTGTFTCTTCDSVLITVSGSPCVADANFSFGTPTSLLVNFSNNSTCMGCTAVNYNWNFGDGSPVSTLMNPSHTYSASGTYTVCLSMTGIDSSGGTCLDTICNVLTLSGSTGISEIESVELVVLPNPVESYATLQLPAQMNLSEIRIFSMNGQQLAILPVNQKRETQQIDCRKLAPGMYLIQLTLENGQHLYTRLQKQ